MGPPSLGGEIRLAVCAVLSPPWKRAAFGRRSPIPCWHSGNSLDLWVGICGSPTARQARAICRLINGCAAPHFKDALLRNLDIAEKSGCLDDAGLAEMRRGKAATVMKGPYKGYRLSVDHIIPRTIAPELDNVIANLELMPERMNESKNARIGDGQRSHAAKLYQAGLPSAECYKTVQRSKQ